MPSKQLRKLLKVVRLFLAAVAYSRSVSRVPRRAMRRHVPYFSQWESRELVGKILAGTIKAEADPSWRTSGALTRSEYAIWSWTGCGMACLKMLLAHQDVLVSLVELGKGCVRYGGYDMPLQSSKGLKYAPFVGFVKDTFDLDAKVVVGLPLSQICLELSRGSYVIASVHPSIRSTPSRPKQKGGHLVLLLGYDLDKQEFYFHNPSGDSTKSQEYAAVTFKDFRQVFGYQGIIVS